MSQLDTPILVSFVLYLLVMISIGIWAYSRNQTLSDFALGGRRLHPFTAALSAQSSDMSGWLLLGLTGTIYASGLGQAWIPVGLLLGTYASWKIVAPRLRSYTARAGDAVSLSAYFEERFEDRGKIVPGVSALRVVSALVVIFFFTCYVAAQLVAGGKLFQDVFGVEPQQAMTIAVLVVIAYCFLGGFLAVSYTDVLQGSLMLLALLAVPLLGVFALGGFGALTSGVEERSGGLFDFGAAVSYQSPDWIDGGSIGAIAIVSGLAWGFGYFGQPHILARYMGIRSTKDVPLARRVAASWTALVLAGAVVVGLVGAAYLDPLEDPETVFIVLVRELTNPWVAGVLLAALLAAIMSTADSQLLVSSTALTEDFHRALLDRDASQKTLLWLSRYAVVTVGLAAYALALSWEASVMGIVEYAWAGFGAAFGPVIVLSLYWSRMSWTGALAGIVVGAAAAGLWQFLDPYLGPLSGLYEMIPGVVLATAAAVGFSRLSAPPSREWRGKYADQVPAG